MIEGPGELLLFQAQDPFDLRAAAAQLGIGVAHLGVERRHHAPEERVAHPQPMSVTNGATHDAPQHVAPTLVRRDDTVDDEERARAHVIRDHPQRLVAGGFAAGGRRAGDFGRRADQVREQVDLVVAVHALEDRGGALQSEPVSTDGLGSGVHVSGGVAVELHEHEVPQLDVAVAVLVGTSRRPARHFGSVVVEHLRARAAGSGVAHRPEVVLLAAAREAGRVDSDLVEPDVGPPRRRPRTPSPRASRAAARALRSGTPSNSLIASRLK